MQGLLEAWDRTAQQLFGEGADVVGTIGTAANPGVVEIRLTGETIGAGRTLDVAMRQASVAMSARCQTKGRQ